MAAVTSPKQRFVPSGRFRLPKTTINASRPLGGAWPPHAGQDCGQQPGGADPRVSGQELWRTRRLKVPAKHVRRWLLLVLAPDPSGRLPRTILILTLPSLSVFARAVPTRCWPRTTRRSPRHRQHGVTRPARLPRRSSTSFSRNGTASPSLAWSAWPLPAQATGPRKALVRILFS